MNRLITTFLFAGFCISSHAQFAKGDRFLGASLASALYNSGSSVVTFPNINGYDSKSSSYNVRIDPTIGWFVSDQTAAGVSLLLNPHGQKIRYMDAGTTFQEDRSSQFNIGLGAFARHYFGSSGDFFPYAQAGFNGGINSGETEGFRYYDDVVDYKKAYKGKSSGGGFVSGSLQLGLTNMIGENVGLDLYTGYTYSYNKNTFKTTTTTDYGIDGTIEATAISEPTTKFTNHGFILGAGIQVFLRKRK